MIYRALCLTVAFAVAVAVAQTVDGEIAGRINDRSGAPLPGVRVTITDRDQSREAITDADGLFAFRSLAMGTYRVATSLAGFIAKSGEVRLSPSNPRAFLGWPLEVGCLEEDVRVNLSAREAAPLVDAILHIRVTAVDGPVLLSVRPECAGRVVMQYSVQVLGSAPGRGRTSTGTRLLFTSTQEARLESGREYVALLWPDGHAMLLPIVSGLVTSPSAGELTGMRLDEALKVLGNWSQERKPLTR